MARQKKEVEVKEPDVKKNVVSKDNADQKGAPPPRRAPGTKEIIPMQWKLVGTSAGTPVTLLKSIERTDVEAQQARLEAEGYYKQLAIYPIEAKVPLSSSHLKAQKRAIDEARNQVDESKKAAEAAKRSAAAKKAKATAKRAKSASKAKKTAKATASKRAKSAAEAKAAKKPKTRKTAKSSVKSSGRTVKKKAASKASKAPKAPKASKASKASKAKVAKKATRKRK